MPLAVELNQESDGSWRAAAPSYPGVVGRGASQETARDDAREQAAAYLAARAELTQRDGWFFVYSPELDITNQAETEAEARDGLREHLVLYLSDD